MRLLSAVLIIVPLVLAAQAPDAIDDPDSWPREQPTALPRIFTDSQEAILADKTRLGGTATTVSAEVAVPQVFIRLSSPAVHPRRSVAKLLSLPLLSSFRCEWPAPVNRAPPRQSPR